MTTSFTRYLSYEKYIFFLLRKNNYHPRIYLLQEKMNQIWNKLSDIEKKQTQYNYKSIKVKWYNFRNHL